MGPELRLAAEREVADPESAEPEPARYQLVEDSAQPVSSEPGWAKDSAKPDSPQLRSAEGWVLPEWFGRSVPRERWGAGREE